MTERAFHDLAIAQLDAVYRLACHLARNSVEAEDFVQETYLRALRSADTFVLGERGMRPWLFKILHNVLVTRGHQKQREKLLLAELAPSRAANAAVTAPPVNCASMDWDNVDQRVKTAIASLAVEYRLAFMLWALEGLKYREIADVTDVPLGTVMSRLARARAHLSEKLTDYQGEIGFNRSGKPLEASSEQGS